MVSLEYKTTTSSFCYPPIKTVKLKSVRNWNSDIKHLNIQWLKSDIKYEHFVKILYRGDTLCSKNVFSLHFIRVSMCRTIIVHYSDDIMDTISSQITSLNRLFRHRKKKISKLRVTCHGPMNSPHKWPVGRKMLAFDDVIMGTCSLAAFTYRKPDLSQILESPMSRILMTYFIDAD